jgi:hypothetical protein
MTYTGKAILVEIRTDREGARRFKFPDYKTIW